MSGTIEIVGPVFSDVFMTERPVLLSFVDLKVILNRSSHEFCPTASEDDYRVKLMDTYVKIRKVKVIVRAFP